MKENSLNIINKYRVPLMGFAAFWIFLSHEQAHEWARIYYPPLILCRTIDFAKSIGFCGVDIFLLLSGVGLVYSIEKHSLLSFYARRIERVFIPYFIVGLIRMFLDDWSFITFLKKIFFYEFLFEGIYGFLWFVPAILILYFCFPFYYRVFKKSKNKVVFTLLALGIWLCLSILLKGTLRSDLYGFTNRIPIFLTGILMGWILREKNIEISKLAWIFLVFIFIAGIILIYLTYNRKMYLLVPGSYSFLPTYLLALSGTLLAAKVFSFIASRPWGSLFIRVFTFMGTISLEIYCVQERLDEIIRPLFTISYEYWMKNFIWINLVIAIAVFSASALLYYLGKFVGSVLFHRNKLDKTH